MRSPAPGSESLTASRQPARTPCARSHREDGRGLHLDRDRARRRARRPRAPGRGRRRGRSSRRAPSGRRAATSSRRQPASGSTRGPAPSARLVPSAASTSVAATSDADASPPVERAARPDADGALDAEHAQLLARRSPRSGRRCRGSDRQRLAVGGLARVAPQPAVVVEHQRAFGQLLGEQQRPARVAGQQNARGERGGRMDVPRPRAKGGEDSLRTCPRARRSPPPAARDRAPTRSGRRSTWPFRRPAPSSVANERSTSPTSSHRRRSVCARRSRSCARRARRPQARRPQAERDRAPARRPRVRRGRRHRARLEVTPRRSPPPPKPAPRKPAAAKRTAAKPAAEAHAAKPAAKRDGGEAEGRGPRSPRLASRPHAGPPRGAR